MDFLTVNVYTSTEDNDAIIFFVVACTVLLLKRGHYPCQAPAYVNGLLHLSYHF